MVHKNHFQISLIFLNCSMLTGCQKLDSLLTRFHMHEFVKKTKLYRPFLGLTDQNMYAQEAQICTLHRHLNLSRNLILAAILDVIFDL